MCVITEYIFNISAITIHVILHNHIVALNYRHHVYIHIQSRNVII